ncbi:MAG: hypothetical protein HZA93_07715 [Verrucomicrobia bacterium]|nr:hypothetical protein [Verrucomicrobiota bacterium]
MKLILRSLPLLLAGLLPFAAIAADTKAAKKDSKAAYPLDTCVVSGEKMTHGDKPFEYVHKEAGKPDRLILLCCEDCVGDFKKEPAKYLAKLDAAAAEKARGKATTGSAHKH